ncbi:MAG: type II toxin-antitoxin system RelE/ParE family toxin [Clostridia bacterium]|jgi:hypothetical protein|nr:type II toxin-antitoxin system RelE/ParE family toxin [Clostridia bacterium]
MTREFIRTNEFDKRCRELSINEFEIRDVESFLCLYPCNGNIIKDSGGLRKLRWKLEGRSKAKSIRIIYIDFKIQRKLYLIFVYSKKDKVNISSKERKEMKCLVKMLRKE